MNNQDIIKIYFPLIDFLSNALGDNFEFALHDLSKPDKTIVAIKNGHITNRKVGDTLSNLTLRVLNEKKITDEEFRTYHEEALFRKGIESEDYIIRNFEGKPIGLFCINYNYKILNDVRSFVNSIFKSSTIVDNRNSIKEIKVKDDIKDDSVNSFINLAESIIDGVIQEYGVEPDRMVAEEKIQIVNKLSEKGVFQLKGIIGSVAEKLCVSEATVYRYLSSI